MKKYEFTFGRYGILVVFATRNDDELSVEVLSDTKNRILVELRGGYENGSFTTDTDSVSWSACFDLDKIDIEEELVVLQDMVLEDPGAVLNIPGVLELIKEEFNNEILDRIEVKEWEKVLGRRGVYSGDIGG